MIVAAGRGSMALDSRLPSADVTDQPSVRDRIRAAIADHGPISFAEFMEIALYSPGGFYDRPPVGEGGHFVTSPHVDPAFATCLAVAIRKAWETLDRPEPFTLIEVGAGDGTLARQLLAELRNLPLEYIAVDRSGGARKALAELPVTLAPSLETVREEIEGVVLANELLDNLPFHRIRRTRRGAVEVRVGLKDGQLVEVATPCNRELEPLARPISPGQEKAVSPDALATIDRVARVLRRGYALFIDYGADAGVQAFRSHQRTGILASPGSADITAGVDFDALASRATEWGLSVWPLLLQSEALSMLGFVEMMQVERRRQVVASLEKRSGRAAVEAWSRRNRAQELVDPDRLGGLWWMWLAKGVDWWSGFPMA